MRRRSLGSYRGDETWFLGGALGLWSFSFWFSFWWSLSEKRGDCRYGWIGVEIKIDGAPETSG